jgi:hypothetical protein
MPQRDGTGPQGKGPKTGRGVGDCAPKAVSKDDRNERLGLQKNAQPARAARRRGGRRTDNM